MVCTKTVAPGGCRCRGQTSGMNAGCTSWDLFVEDLHSEVIKGFFWLSLVQCNQDFLTCIDNINRSGSWGVEYDRLLSEIGTRLNALAFPTPRLREVVLQPNMACTSRMFSHICCPKACCKALISQQRDGVLEFHFGSGRKYNLFPTHGACLHGRIMRSAPSPMTTVSWCSATEMAVWAIKTSASPGACTTGMPCCWNTVQRRLINLCLLAWFDRNLSFMTVQTMSGLKCTVGPIAPLPHRFCVPCLVVGPDSYPSIMIGFCICYAHSDPLELQCPARISLFPSIYGAIVLLHQVHEQLLQEHQHHGWRSISTLRLLGLACQLQEVYPRYGRGWGITTQFILEDFM